VRFGIVGVGMEGTGLLTTAIQLPGVECAAACDLYDGRHELAREIVGKPIPPGGCSRIEAEPVLYGGTPGRLLGTAWAPRPAGLR
jgi:hypothetical protein